MNHSNPQKSVDYVLDFCKRSLSNHTSKITYNANHIINYDELASHVVVTFCVARILHRLHKTGKTKQQPLDLFLLILYVSSLQQEATHDKRECITFSQKHMYINPCNQTNKQYTNGRIYH